MIISPVPGFSGFSKGALGSCNTLDFGWHDVFVRLLAGKLPPPSCYPQILLVEELWDPTPQSSMRLAWSTEAAEIHTLASEAFQMRGWPCEIEIHQDDVVCSQRHWMPSVVICDIRLTSLSQSRV